VLHCNDYFSAFDINVAMIRAKDGATAAPQQVCLTQASDLVSGSTSAGYYWFFTFCCG
jgi:hypothetical protein